MCQTHLSLFVCTVTTFSNVWIPCLYIYRTWFRFSTVLVTLDSS
jgi:hypothetical protein